MNELDHPFYEVAENAGKLIEETGCTIYVKFTCAKCGARQTFDVPNTFYKEGECEECGHVSDVEKQGCNFVMVYG